MYRLFKIFMGVAIGTLIFILEASAQMNRSHDKVAPYTPELAAERWAEFSASKIATDYCMDFTITHTPRKDEQVVYDGEIFGAVRGKSTLTRIRLGKIGGEIEADYILISNPQRSEVWKMSDGKFIEIPEKDWNIAFMKGLLYSPFDILMPYHFWTPKYAGAGRIGQAVHYYDLTPKSNDSEISKVKIAITREFNSPAAADFFDKSGNKIKTMHLGAVRKVDDFWIMLEANVRNEMSRDKDKLRFTSAKMNANLDDSIFNPKSNILLPNKPQLKKL